MARIVGVNLPPNKKVKIGLTYIFGVGPSTVRAVLQVTKIDPEKRIKDLTSQEIDKLKGVIEKNYKVEGELRRQVVQNIKRLKDIGCYRGDRHKKNLPVRGQRTKVNSRTVRGNVRRTLGSGHKDTPQKT